MLPTKAYRTDTRRRGNLIGGTPLGPIEVCYENGHLNERRRYKDGNKDSSGNILTKMEPNQN